MQETTVLILLRKPRATWHEVGQYLCWVVVLVASVFTSVRWLLCGGDGSKNEKKKKKTTSVISKKMFRERIYPHHGFNYFEKIKNRIELQILPF